jgi:hypothetical protein
MRTSLPYHRQPVPVPGDDQFTERLRGLNQQQLQDAMTFVAFWSPGTFTAALDYCETTSWGWFGFDPDLAPDPDNDDHPEDDPAPVCAQCGANLGIFLKFGLDWRHYRGEALDDIELYDPGHAPKLTWRAPAPVPLPTPDSPPRTAPGTP